MKYIYRTVAVVAVVLLLGVGWVWWQREADSGLNEQRVVVAATIFPLADMAERVGGEQVKVVQLVPTGASPHTYSLRPNQLAELREAEVLFAVGHNLDSRAVKDASGTADTPVVVVDDNISLREFGDEEDDHGAHEEDDHEHDEGSVDPHYWLTIPNGQEITRTMARRLGEIDPEHASAYERNAREYAAELDAVETELQDMVARGEQRAFVAIHDAWSYFSDHYGLELVATYEPVEGREPSVRDIQELQQVIAQHGIDTFFTEPQKQGAGAARFLREELGLEISVLDPIGGVGSRDSYAAMMRENMRAITGR